MWHRNVHAPSARVCASTANSVSVRRCSCDSILIPLSSPLSPHLSLSDSAHSGVTSAKDTWLPSRRPGTRWEAALCSPLWCWICSHDASVHGRHALVTESVQAREGEARYAQAQPHPWFVERPRSSVSCRRAGVAGVPCRVGDAVASNSKPPACLQGQTGSRAEGWGAGLAHPAAGTSDPNRVSSLAIERIGCRQQTTWVVASSLFKSLRRNDRGFRQPPVKQEQIQPTVTGMLSFSETAWVLCFYPVVSASQSDQDEIQFI